MKYKKCAILVAFFTKDPKYKSCEITNSVQNDVTTGVEIILVF